ncbi:GPI-anchored protein PB15E9.01c [Biomphalaria pfeifferi]|uniref:GPI-anchored protein PB15E9.01c n=1 Tax=Biomphalaria pfeifferi TaxID=112525 RepID=A0AAD8BTC2_BIOPF|nr:GPI-anchored protein PB15E9.01c [Biomphalaria pfeifferi]
MKYVELFTSITLLIIILIGTPGADGATCTTYSTCQVTDFTLSTCASNTCACLNSSYVPIRSGCALQLTKPVITASDPTLTTLTNSNQVIAGSKFVLACNVQGAATYEWYKGGTKISSETANTYNVTSAAAENVGSFTCKGIGSETTLTSELSNAFVMELLGTGGSTTSSVQPTVNVPVASVVSGSSVTLGCYNIPIGYSGTIKYQVDGKDVVAALQITETNKDKSVTCAVDSSSGGVTYSNPKSAAKQLPTLITNIQSVSVKVNSKLVEEVIDKNNSPTVLLTCAYSPINLYLGSSPSIVYAWTKNGKDLPSTKEDLILTEGGNYSCSVKMDSQSAVPSSNKVVVTLTDDKLLTASSNKPVTGGRVILTCGDVRTDGATYSWKKDDVIIARQFDRKLQIDNLVDADKGRYSCTIEKDLFYRTYDSVSIEVHTTITKPTINTVGCGVRYAENGDYWLSCDTLSESIGMTYEWTVKGTLSSTVKTKYYSLKGITSLNNGDYTCKAKLGTAASEASDKETVAVTTPGKVCYNDFECIAAQTGYSGVCGTNDRCTCADGYRQEGEVCTNGVLAVVSSTLTMASVLLLSKLI